MRWANLQQSGDHIRDRSTTEEPNEQYSLIIIIESFPVGEFEKQSIINQWTKRKKKKKKKKKSGLLI